MATHKERNAGRAKWHIAHEDRKEAKMKPTIAELETRFPFIKLLCDQCHTQLTTGLNQQFRPCDRCWIKMKNYAEAQQRDAGRDQAVESDSARSDAPQLPASTVAPAGSASG
jgi:hypothetical protein